MILFVVPSCFCNCYPTLAMSWLLLHGYLLVWQKKKNVYLNIVFFSCWNNFATGTPLWHWVIGNSLNNDLFDKRKKTCILILYCFLVETILLPVPHSGIELLATRWIMTWLTKEKIGWSQNCIFFLLQLFCSWYPTLGMSWLLLHGYLLVWKKKYCLVFPTL